MKPTAAADLKVDAGLPGELSDPRGAAESERSGYHGCWTGEIDHLQTGLRELSLGGQRDGMGTLVDDEIFGAFAVVAPVGEVAEKPLRRCGGVLDRVLLGLPAALSETAATTIVNDLRCGPKRLKQGGHVVATEA